MHNLHALKLNSSIEGWEQQDPEEAFTLPSRYFFDETLFKAERDNIFMHAWHVAGHTSEFAEPGQYVVVDLFDQSIVIARNRQDQIHAFHNVCQHRGNRLPGQAHSLLQQTRLSVAQVAACSGFGSLEHFSRTYRAKFGCPPSEDRSQVWTAPVMRQPLSKEPRSSERLD